MSRERCLRALNGWFFGCLTATAVLDAIIIVVLTLLAPERSPKNIVDAMFITAVFFLPVTFFAICVLTAVPAVFLIWFGERLRTPAMVFYVGCGVVVGALFCALLFNDVGWLGAAFVLAGCPAGFVYWRLAGRYVGETY